MKKYYNIISELFIPIGVDICSPSGGWTKAAPSLGRRIDTIAYIVEKNAVGVLAATATARAAVSDALCCFFLGRGLDGLRRSFCWL